MPTPFQNSWTNWHYHYQKMRVLSDPCEHESSFWSSSLPKCCILGVFKIFFYFIWRLITLQYCIGFAIHWHESAMSVHVLTPLPPPSPYHPSGSPSAPAPSILYHASKLDWWFVSHMIIYMFQCHTPKSSHHQPLPQSTKDCSIHLCLFCCLTYSVIITIFLNSIYMCYYTGVFHSK